MIGSPNRSGQLASVGVAVELPSQPSEISRRRIAPPKLQWEGFLKTALVLLLMLSLPALALAQDVGQAPPDQGDGNKAANDILDMDIEQLAKVDVVVPSMDIEVTSVSKQESTVGRSPAAVFVITAEMIRRNGATSVPELLRMVPGLEVARINSSIWAITSRGFNGRFANKLLVLIDGRTVYTPLYSGVYWDVQDMLLEDIERIEVIRGPGGTLWGANAVNGVINIITKNAKDTQGALVTAGGGSQDRAIDGVRCGGNNGRGLYWRVYGKHFERAGEFNPSGAAHDDWRIGRGGFRVDWEPDPDQSDTLTVLGNYYGGNEGQSGMAPMPVLPYTRHIIEDETVSGANVLTRWTHVIDDESDWQLQMYYDRTYRDYELLKQQVNTMDIDFQHRFPLAEHHKIIWGLDYRMVRDYIPATNFVVSFFPTQRTTNLFSAFVQDEIELIDDRLFLTVGSKFEHNDYTGFEYQPSARLLWTPDRRHSAWAAISRAVRTPARGNDDLVSNLGPIFDPSMPFPIFYRLIGSKDTRSEDLLAYEIGYRAQTTEHFAWDVAGFYNVYDNLVWTTMGTPFFENTYLVLPAVGGNNERGQSYGIELAGHWTPSDTWRVSASYTYLKINIDNPPGPPNPISYKDSVEGSSPRNQAQVHSFWDIGHDWEFGLALRYVDNLSFQSVPAYIDMNAQLAWVPSKNFELAIVGQNLLNTHHPEFNAEWYNTDRAEIKRSVFTKVTCRY